MNRWEAIDTAEIPRGGGQLRLLQRGSEFAIRIARVPGDLMNSRTHGSEDALGKLACAPLKAKPEARVLVGGLGMGFTLAAALKELAADAQVMVAELVPGVVEWNQSLLGHCAGNPLQDARVQLKTADVAQLIGSARESYDAILLDVDNGPEGLTHEHNDQLYSLQGLVASYSALRESGVLAVWSASPAPQFTGRLRKAGFAVTEQRVRAHQGKGARHTIWLAQRD